MALIICPECNKDISSKARSCPNCGFPLNSKIIEWNIENENKKKKREFLDSLDLKKSSRKSKIKKDKEKSKKQGCLGALIIFLIFIIIIIFNDSDDNDPTYKSISKTTSKDISKSSSVAIKYSKVSLNVRKRPNVKSKVIKILKPNKKVFTKGEQENGYTQILNSSNRNYGWCSTQYLQDTPLSKSQLADLEEKKKEAKRKQENAWRNEDRSVAAWLYAKDIVKRSLKSPSTADFPSSIFYTDYVSRNGQVYTIRSYVDSQNGFGAMIRSTFTVKIEQVSKDNWILLAINID